MIVGVTRLQSIRTASLGAPPKAIAGRTDWLPAPRLQYPARQPSRRSSMCNRLGMLNRLVLRNRPSTRNRPNTRNRLSMRNRLGGRVLDQGAPLLQPIDGDRYGMGIFTGAGSQAASRWYRTAAQDRSRPPHTGCLAPDYVRPAIEPAGEPAGEPTGGRHTAVPGHAAIPSLPMGAATAGATAGRTNRRQITARLPPYWAGTCGRCAMTKHP